MAEQYSKYQTFAGDSESGLDGVDNTPVHVNTDSKLTAYGKYFLVVVATCALTLLVSQHGPAQPFVSKEEKVAGLDIVPGNYFERNL
jgi:hypothetical protein